MTRKITPILFIVALLVVLTVALTVAQEPATVSVGHGIPGEDVGQDPALPVDVIVNGGCLLHDFEFGMFSDPLELPADTYSIALALSDGDDETCSGPVVLGPVDLPFAEGENVTVFAHLTADGNPGPAGVDVLELGITATVFENDVSEIIAGHTRLTVRHAAWAPAVDILLNRGWVRGRESGEIMDLANGEQSEPADLRPGAYAVSIFPAGEEEPVFQLPETEEDRPLVTNPHRSELVYAVGSLENETFTLIKQLLDLDKVPPPRPVPPE